MNTNDYNVWIRQPLHAGDLWEVEPKEWSYKPVLTHNEDTNDVEINFVQVPPEEFREEIFSEAAETAEDKSSEETSGSSCNKEDRPKIGPRPDLESEEFDFKTELEKLPFTLNIGEAPLIVEQQKQFIQLIYDNQEVLSLYDGDLGYCEKIKHSIPTTTGKPVYLPHRQIPIQLQSEVRKCLEAWLKASIIRPSKQSLRFSSGHCL